MLEKDLLSRLKELSKDEASFKQLVEIVGAERDEALKYKNYLSLLESAVRNDYDSIIVTDLELDNPGPRICYVNDGFEKMTGYMREEVIGKTPRVLQGEKTDRATLDRLRSNLTKGNSFFGQTVNYRKDGSEYINQWDIHPLTDRDGKITHWVSYQHDITDRKRSEKKVVDTSTEFDDLFEESKKAYIDLTHEGVVADSNKSAREMLGYQKEEMDGKHIWEFTPSNAVANIKSVFNDTSVENFGSNNALKIIFRRKNGLPLQAELRFKNVSNNGTKLLRAIVSNASMKKNVLEILKKRNIGFDKIFDRKNDFTYGFSKSESGSVYIEWISDGFEALTGYTADECKGEDGFNKLIHPEDLTIAKLHYLKVTNGVSSTQQFRIIAKNGEVKKVVDYSKPDIESEGAFKGSFVAAGENELETV
ncbi:MAG: PAS domain S-box protein [Balneolales bacterium]|nr:PAS domain S-box protein [Balneolales bacterium]